MKADGYAKFWLRPAQLVHSEGLTPSQLRRVRELVEEHGPLFLERWNEYFVHEPHATQVEFTADSIVVSLDDGRTISAPLEWFPRLRSASADERRQWRLVGRGIGIHWEALDEDLSVRGLLEGVREVTPLTRAS